MDVQEIVKIVVEQISAEPGIEGAFLYGAAHDGTHDNNEQDQDPFTSQADLRIGIVTKDTLKEFRKAYTLHEDILPAIGQPVFQLEEEEQHIRRVTALYGKTQYPPTGMKVMLVFSQLKYLDEQEPYVGWKLILDRAGEVQAALEQLTPAPAKTQDEIAQELKQQISAYAMHLYDVARAFERKDRADVQALTEQMRSAIYYAAALRAGRYARGAWRGLHYLAPGEKWVLEYSYQNVTRKTVQKLTDLYLACLGDVQARYAIEQDVQQLKQSLPELL
jgi:hypothetical protein